MSAGNGRGLLWACTILLAWALSLVALMVLDLGSLPARIEAPLLIAAVLLRAFLHTGLFIVGHDAMHGLLRPGAVAANRRWGQLSLALYAALPYEHCLRQHQQHHSFTASPRDPDGQPPDQALAGWFVHFLANYLSWRQMALLLGGWAALALLCSRFTPTAAFNLLLFCVLPLLLSSLQLFLFGTYLPHRRQGASSDQHHARSLNLPVWLSLLACYHFGYHWEHHHYPHLAWFELPSSRCQSAGDRVRQVWQGTAWRRILAWPNRCNPWLLTRSPFAPP